MRSLLASLVLAGAGVFAAATPAQAHGPGARVYVSFGDVAFMHGRPFHRHMHNLPLHVIADVHGPRYYYYAPAGYLPPPPPPHVHRYDHRHNDHRHGHRAPPRPGYPRYRDGYYR